MQNESATGPWERRCDEQEAQQLCCDADDHRTRFADGVIEVRTIGGICTAKVIWHGGYGERALERGPYAFVHARVGEIIRHGPSFGPVHTPDRERLEFFPFTSDRSLRATRPHGELRIKLFLDQFVLLYVPDGGFRLLSVAEESVKLVQAAETYGALWASLAGPRWAVWYQGKYHELRVSNLASELAFCEVDRRTRFSLRAHSLPDGDLPPMAALDLVCGDHATQVALVPFSPDSDMVVIWSEDQVARASPPPSHVSPPPASAAARTACSSTEATAGSIHPAVRVLLEKYVRWFAEQPGQAQGWRRQISPLLRAAERGVNEAGWGVRLRRALERAGGFAVDSGPRAFCYWVKALRDDGILVRDCGRRRSEFVFAELRDPNSRAVAQLCAWAGVPVASLLDAGAAGEPTERAASGPPPSGRTPPTTPPPSPPGAGGRENTHHTSPVSPPAPHAPPSAPPPRSAEQARAPAQPPSSPPSPPDITEPPAPSWPPTAPPAVRGAGEPTRSPTAPPSFVNWPGADGTGARGSAASTPRPSTPPVDVFDDGEEVMGRPSFLFLGRTPPQDGVEDVDADQEIGEGDGSARGPPDEDPDPGEPDGA